MERGAAQSASVRWSEGCPAHAPFWKCLRGNEHSLTVVWGSVAGGVKGLLVSMTTANTMLDALFCTSPWLQMTWFSSSPPTPSCKGQLFQVLALHLTLASGPAKAESAVTRSNSVSSAHDQIPQQLSRVQPRPRVLAVRVCVCGGVGGPLVDMIWT